MRWSYIGTRGKMIERKLFLKGVTKKKNKYVHKIKLVNYCIGVVIIGFRNCEGIRTLPPFSY